MDIIVKTLLAVETLGVLNVPKPSWKNSCLRLGESLQNGLKFSWWNSCWCNWDLAKKSRYHLIHGWMLWIRDCLFERWGIVCIGFLKRFFDAHPKFCENWSNRNKSLRCFFWRTPQESAGFKFKTTYLKNQKNVQYIPRSLDLKQIHLKLFHWGLQSALLPKSPVSTSKAVLSSMVSMF